MALGRSATDGRVGSARTRVAIVLPTHWSHVMGGAEYQCRVLCEHLVADGRFEVSWLSRRIAPGYIPLDYQVIQAGRARSRLAKAYFLDRTVLQSALDRVNPDVIYQRSGSGWTGLTSEWAARNRRRMVWHAASDGDIAPPIGCGQILRSPLRGWDRRWLEKGIRQATHVVVQTHAQANALKMHFGRDDALVVRNFHPDSKDKIDRADPPRVLWVANLKRVKQPQRFVELARACADLPVQFEMIGESSVGDDDWMSRLRSAMASTPNLRYLGRLTQEEVNRHLACASLLVNTSLHEGFSNTFIQAWQRGVPVLSLNVDPDNLLATSPGLGACADGDMARLQGLLRDWLSDQSRLALASAAARRHASVAHSMANIDQLVALLASPPEEAGGVEAVPGPAVR